MSITFTKMQGCGNDFVVIDATQTPLTLTPTNIAKMADRHYGIGFDQLLVIEPDTSADFNYRIFNANGSEAEQCGNGARCVARYIADNGLSTAKTVTLKTKGGVIETHIEDNTQVKVDMGTPIFKPKDIPTTITKQQLIYTIEVGDAEIKLGLVNIGNPHAVLCVDDLNTVDIEQVGAAISTHACFPEEINVGFMQIAQPYQMQLQVFERGVGKTLACGSGACAAVVYGHQLGILDREVNVIQPGGELLIDWVGGDNSVYMTGPTETLFKGEWIATVCA